MANQPDNLNATIYVVNCHSASMWEWRAYQTSYKR